MMSFELIGGARQTLHLSAAAWIMIIQTDKVCPPPRLCFIVANAVRTPEGSKLIKLSNINVAKCIDPLKPKLKTCKTRAAAEAGPSPQRNWTNMDCKDYVRKTLLPKQAKELTSCCPNC